MIKTIVFEERAALLCAFLDGIGWLYGTSPVQQERIEFTILQVGEHVPHDPMEAAHFWVSKSVLFHTVIMAGLEKIEKEFRYERKES